jgi:NADPH-dependent glutamate synthase beta subunit-like oxidoreductase
LDLPPVDQKELHRYEQRCIQEEAPECEAACPLHVDARALAGSMAQENWAEAWKTLRRHLPLPGILGRICDAPCRVRCRRGDVGDPIDIGGLERALAAHTDPTPLKLPPILPKNKSVAVWGSGLSSLTLVWDLARKGYALTLFEPAATLGGHLLATHPNRLSTAVIADELAAFERLGVTIQLNSDLTVDAFLSAEMDVDARFLGLEGMDGADRERLDRIENLFYGGASDQSAHSPVWQAAEGRWAATTIDRYLQKVSLSAGREKEGPYTTRLFTRIDDIVPLPVVQPADAAEGYTLDEAVREAKRCIQCECLECVKVCAYLAHYKGYPKVYAREIYNNDSIVMGARQANKMINTCSLCGLCERVCPEEFAMQDLCLEARRQMVTKEKMPPSAHEFALLDMAFSQGPAFALARQDPDLDTAKASSAHLFFPGCQLCASTPQTVFDVYAYLRRKLKGGVGLMLDCCAAPAHWAGREEPFRQALTRLAEKWQGLGKPKLVVACSTCLKVFKEHLGDIPVTSLWETLVTTGLPQRDPNPAVPNVLAIHDPCTARYAASVQQAVRRLAADLGVSVEELPLSGETTECCGFGGLMQNAHPEVAELSRRHRAALSRSPYLAYCGMCRDNLKAAGKPTVHLLDLIFPPKGRSNPADRPRPGWSQRQENRARLKERFLTELWKESPPEMAAYEKIRLQMAPEVAELLEHRRILVSDIQKVICHAETSGEKFRHQASGHFKAAHMPYKATFWVEYAREEDADTYTIYNAYAHRMTVVPEGEGGQA